MRRVIGPGPSMGFPRFDLLFSLKRSYITSHTKIVCYNKKCQMPAVPRGLVGSTNKFKSSSALHDQQRNTSNRIHRKSVQSRSALPLYMPYTEHNLTLIIGMNTAPQMVS